MLVELMESVYIFRLSPLLIGKIPVLFVETLVVFVFSHHLDRLLWETKPENKRRFPLHVVETHTVSRWKSCFGWEKNCFFRTHRLPPPSIAHLTGHEMTSNLRDCILHFSEGVRFQVWWPMLCSWSYRSRRKRLTQFCTIVF